ncbi:hypothetical protein BED46_028220 [Burkholderia contaminans]|nr:hypothetical protein BGI28_37390 [Burkholderia contaminans]OMI75528.1 hypothetical protein BED46_028220 [Burkholderia contaminans]RBQ61784.1 hypothetical protein DI458_14165 [Burkholderia contaminans]
MTMEKLSAIAKCQEMKPVLSSIQQSGFAAQMMQNGTIEVQDPVLCLGVGGKNHTEYRTIKLHGAKAARHFIIERS